MDDLYRWLIEHSEQASALSAIASTVIALIALIIALVSLATTFKTIRIQRDHNIIAVRPIPRVQWKIADGIAKVALANNGLGTLIVKNIIVRSEDGIYHDFQVVAFSMKSENLKHYFSFDNADKTIPSDSEMLLVSFRREDNKDFETGELIELVSLFSAMSVEVEYTDLYGSKFSKYVKNLSTIGRLLGQRTMETQQ